MSNAKQQLPLLNFLLQHNLLKDSDLPSKDIILDGLRSKKLIQLLSQLKIISEKDILIKLGSILNLEYIDLQDYSIVSKLKCEDFQNLNIENEFYWNAKIVPLWRESSFIAVAVADPFEKEALQTFSFTTGLNIKPYLAEEYQISLLLSEYFPPTKINYDALDSLDIPDGIEIMPSEKIKTSKDEGYDLLPVVLLCNKIIADAIELKATDVHIDPEEDFVSIKARIDGRLQPLMEIPKRLHNNLMARFKILTGMDISEKRLPQDGRFKVRIGDKVVNVRAASSPTANGESLSLRILSAEGVCITFSSLGMDKEISDEVKSLLIAGSKAFLVVGPTGSGKTTTLYGAINFLRNNSNNIITVEDPVEYNLRNIKQIQVNSEIGLSFAQALRSVLRQDPDIIMIGEIRDKETADIALQAAATGHLVLSSLHAINAIAALERLKALGVPPYEIASNISGILGQRLIRKLCPHCKRELTAKERLEHKSILDLLPELSESKLFTADGCAKCIYLKYQGRIAVYSLLSINDLISSKIVKEESFIEIEQIAEKLGYCSLFSSAIKLVQDGVTSLDEIKPLILETKGSCELRENHKGGGVQDIPSIIDVKRDNGVKEVRKKRIMLIEDDENVRAVLSMLLQKEMFEVIEAENGLDALEKIYANTPDLILTDLMMPGLNGKELLVRLKNNAETRDIPVMVLTAVDEEKNEIELLDYGADDFIVKTSSSQVILTRVRKALARFS